MLTPHAAASGDATAKLDGRYLHSPTNPQREAERTARDIVRREPPCVVLLGVGLGYTAEAVLNGTTVTHILAFEPNDELSASFAELRDLSRLTDSPRVTWCRTTEELADSLLHHAAAGFEIVTLQARRLADEEAFSQADAAIAAFQSRIDINSATLARFGRLWVRNLCRNLPVLARGVPVGTLRDTFTGLPGLLLAAGPGLDQVLPHLPDLARRTVVVAVDTAVGAAMENGVEPDVAVVVDPQYWNARHLDQITPGRTILVAESSTHPSVFSHFSQPQLFCSSLFPLGRAIESALGPMGALGTGGSVSTTAWDLLRFTGCSRIFIAGLDLGFPGGRTHFRGSFFETLAVALAGRTSPAENTLHRYVNSAQPFPVPARGGPPVLTDRRMEVYRAWFARQLAQADSPETLTLSAGGALIDGLELASLADTATLPEIRDEITSRLAPLHSRAAQNPEPRAAAIMRGIGTLTEDLEALAQVASDALSAVATIESDLSAGKSADFSSLGDLDARIAASSAAEIVSFLMQDAISAIRSGFGSQSVDEQVSASRDLYTSLLDSVAFHREILRESRIDKV